MQTDRVFVNPIPFWGKRKKSTISDSHGSLALFLEKSPKKEVGLVYPHQKSSIIQEGKGD